jgi:N-acetyl-anhydromuramyl-L-alanine amidase AmpD
MLIVVLHQTISTAKDFLEFIPTANFSYHCFVDNTGKITYLVPSSRQALACANCFIKDVESVDKFAYQICFESLDGALTDNQYMTLGWLLSQLGTTLNDLYLHSEISPSTDLKLISRDKVNKAYNKFLPNKTIYTGLE